MRRAPVALSGFAKRSRSSRNSAADHPDSLERTRAPRCADRNSAAATVDNAKIIDQPPAALRIRTPWIPYRRYPACSCQSTVKSFSACGVSASSVYLGPSSTLSSTHSELLSGADCLTSNAPMVAQSPLGVSLDRAISQTATQIAAAPKLLHSTTETRLAPRILGDSHRP
jgi:hypothetical protein